MGLINHNAVLATTWSEDHLSAIRKWIDRLPPEESSLFTFTEKTRVNGYWTILCGPDGSKEGWPESRQGDEVRKKFVEKLQGAAYDDGSNSWDWIEVGYGEFGASIESTNCSDCYGVSLGTALARVSAKHE